MKIYFNVETNHYTKPDDMLTVHMPVSYVLSMFKTLSDEQIYCDFVAL